MNPSRRSILKQVGLLAAGSTLPISRVSAEEMEALPSALLPYLQNPAPDAMTVCFLSREATEVRVAWVRDGQNKLAEVDATSTEIPGTPWTIWKARLTGLQPGGAYSYRVRHFVKTEREETPTFSFKTPDPRAAEMKTIVFNDIHDRIPTLEALMGYVKPEDYDFTIFNGDMINDPSAANGAEHVFRLWNEYVRILDGSQKPILFVRGNHEVRGSFRHRLGYLFDLPHLSMKEDEADQQWQYAFTVGRVHFVVTDTGEDDSPTTDPTSYKRPRFWEAFRRKQSAWLDKHLAGSEIRNARHRVFVSHIPLHNPAGWFSIVSRDEWSPRLEKAGFDVMLAGHDHSWKIIPANKKFEIRKNKEDTDKAPCPVVIGGGPSMKEGTVIFLEADEKGMRARMLAADGKVLYRGRFAAG